MLLLVEAVLGRPWHLRCGEARRDLTAEVVRACEHDSVTVPDSDEIVVYLRHQAVPRYVILFERQDYPPPPLSGSLAFPRAANFGVGRYVQRLHEVDLPFGTDACERCLALG